MARARLIKPGFFSNEDLCELPPFARLLFAGLWTIADKEGRLDDRPKRIKAEVFPYDDVNVPELLDALEERQFIQRYVIEAAHFIQIVSFRKHQHPHIKEADSIIPAPVVNEHCASTGNSGASAGRDEESSGTSPAVTNTVPITVPDPDPIPDPVTRAAAPLKLPARAVVVGFEQAFGRLLSPTELELVKALEDEHPQERLEFALREAAALNKRSVRYVQRTCERLANDQSNGTDQRLAAAAAHTNGVADRVPDLDRRSVAIAERKRRFGG